MAKTTATILGKHGEQAAHQEAGHDLGFMALAFKGSAKCCQSVSRFAGHLGADLGRVERVRVSPDQAQAVASLFIPQVVHGDAAAVAIWVLRVALALAGEIGVNLDHMTHVHNQQKRGPAIIARNSTGVAIGLISGAQHGVIPAPCAACAMAFAGRGGQIGQQGRLGVIWCRITPRALLGFLLLYRWRHHGQSFQPAPHWAD